MIEKKAVRHRGRKVEEGSIMQARGVGRSDSSTTTVDSSIAVKLDEH